MDEREPTVFDSLIGKVLANCYVSDGEDFLKIECSDNHTLFVEVIGDCCSESWWADIIGFKSAVGGIVLSVEALDLPEVDDNRCRQEYDVQYGYSIKTSNGTVTLAFRNSSNGYYGGWAKVKEKVGHQKWKQIKTDDWVA